MRGQHLTTQHDLNAYVEYLREEGYPYLGSDDARHQLVNVNGELMILWDVPGEPEWEYTLSTQEEFADSVFEWWHDL